MEEKNEINQNKNGRKKTGLIIAVIGLLLIIGSSIYAIIGTDLFKDEKNNDKDEQEEIKDNNDNKDSKDSRDNESIIYNGVYEKDGITIKIFKTDGIDIGSLQRDFYVKFDIILKDGIISSYFDNINNNTGKASIIDDEYTIVFSNNQLELTANDVALKENSSLKNGVYKKTKDYTIEDYYNDNIGDIKYLNSKYNGKYNFNGNEMFIYQTSEDEVNLILSGNSESSIAYLGKQYIINDDGTLKEDVFFDDDKPDTQISFDNENIIFSSNEFPDINGTYIKERNLTIEEIIALE